MTIKRPAIEPIRSAYNVKFLSDAQLDDLQEATLQILEDVGVRFPSDKALAIFEERGHKPGRAKATLLIGSIRFRQNDYTEAAACYRQSLNLEKEIGNKRGEALARSRNEGDKRFGGDDPRKRRFAQAAASAGQHAVGQSLTPLKCRLDRNRDLLLDGRLADHLVEVARSMIDSACHVH